VLIVLLAQVALARDFVDEQLELSSPEDAAALEEYAARRILLTGVTRTDVSDVAQKTTALLTGDFSAIEHNIEDFVAVLERDWEEVFNSPLEEMVDESWAVFEGDSRQELPAWTFAELTGDVETQQKLKRRRALTTGLGGLFVAGGAALIAVPLATMDTLDSESIPLLMGGGATAIVGLTGVTFGLKTRTAPVTPHYTPQRAAALTMLYNDALRTSLDLSEEATFGLDLSIDRPSSSHRLSGP